MPGKTDRTNVGSRMAHIRGQGAHSCPPAASDASKRIGRDNCRDNRHGSSDKEREKITVYLRGVSLGLLIASLAMAGIFL